MVSWRSRSRRRRARVASTSASSRASARTRTTSASADTLARSAAAVPARAAGKPVIVHGDGTTQWTLTHADDFAVAFVGLLGHPAAIGEDFTITGTHAPTWNQIYTWLGDAAGVEPELVHVASETVALVAPDLGPGLVGDKAHSMVFDCRKVSALVPDFRTTVSYDEGAKQQIAWFDAHPEAQQVDAELDAVFDRLVQGARSF